jgi:general secretion pathway protein F
VYPAFLLALAPISLIIIATVLIPNIAPLFENTGAQMPLALRGMLWASHEIEVHGLLWLGGLIALAMVLVRYGRSNTVRALFQKFPIVRGLVRRREASRICRALGSMLKSGAALQVALEAVADVVDDPSTKLRLVEARDKVSSGQKLGDALKNLSSLSSSALQMIAIGEETNQLSAMLLYVADTEERALTSAIDRLMTLLTPVLTVLMGLMVGGIVMSIMQAILSVNELVVP